MVLNLRNDVYEKAQHLPMKFYDKTSTGSVINRISGDTATIQSFMLRMTQEVIVQFFTLIGIVVVMLCINWQVAVFVLLVFAVCVALTRIVSLGSILGAVQFVVLSFVYSMGNTPLMRLYITLLALPIGLLVILRHTENIRRLLKGEETPIKPKKSEDK